MNFFKPILLGVVVIGVSVLGISVMSSMLSVATAPSRVISKTLETDNIIQSYEWFYDVNSQYITRHSQVSQYKDILGSETDQAEKRKLRIDLGAMQHSCRTLANNYNANSLKMNKSIFKGWSLPDTLDATNCN